MKGYTYAPEDLVYEKKLALLGDQVDMTRRLRMAELFRLMEEVSVAHTEALGCTRAETLDRGLLWVITRQLVEIDELPAYDDRITVRGWQGDMMHVFFPRFYEIEKAGRVIIRAQALWALINEESREIIMPEDYGIELPARPGSGDIMLPPISMPQSAGGPLVSTKLTTRYSQMDINGHMNNTGYFNIIDDAVWADVAAADEVGTDTVHASEIMPVPRSLLINYMSEVPYGTCFTLNEFRTRNDRKNCSAIRNETDRGDAPPIRHESDRGGASPVRHESDRGSLPPIQSGDTLWFEGAAEKPYFRVKIEY